MDNIDSNNYDMPMLIADWHKDITDMINKTENINKDKLLNLIYNQYNKNKDNLHNQLLSYYLIYLMYKNKSYNTIRTYKINLYPFLNSDDCNLCSSEYIQQYFDNCTNISQHNYKLKKMTLKAFYIWLINNHIIYPGWLRDVSMDNYTLSYRSDINYLNNFNNPMNNVKFMPYKLLMLYDLNDKDRDLNMLIDNLYEDLNCNDMTERNKYICMRTVFLLSLIINYGINAEDLVHLKVSQFNDSKILLNNNWFKMSDKLLSYYNDYMSMTTQCLGSSTWMFPAMNNTEKPMDTQSLNRLLNRVSRDYNFDINYSMFKHHFFKKMFDNNVRDCIIRSITGLDYQSIQARRIVYEEKHNFIDSADDVLYKINNKP